MRTSAATKSGVLPSQSVLSTTAPRAINRATVSLRPNCHIHMILSKTRSTDCAIAAILKWAPESSLSFQVEKLFFKLNHRHFNLKNVACFKLKNFMFQVEKFHVSSWKILCFKLKKAPSNALYTLFFFQFSYYFYYSMPLPFAALHRLHVPLLPLALAGLGACAAFSLVSPAPTAAS